MRTDVTSVELDLVIQPGDTIGELAGQIAATGDRDITVESTGDGPNGWPTAVFSGPYDQLEAMLWEHGFEDGVETYEVIA